MVTDDFCGTPWPRLPKWPFPLPWPWWLLGRLDAVTHLLSEALVMARGMDANAPGATVNPSLRGTVAAANSLLSAMEDSASHCELKDVIGEGVAATAEVLRLIDAGAPGDEIVSALRFSITIIIKIGRVTITIEF